MATGSSSTETTKLFDATTPQLVIERTPSQVSANDQKPPQRSGRSAKSVELNIGQGSTFDTCLMATMWTLFVVFGIVVTLGDWLFLPRDPLDWCRAAQRQADGIVISTNYPNPDANSDPCYYERTPYLLGWNQFECDFARRMIYSVILGACIGFERKSQDRPAGVRTMSIVCLGSAIFTMSGQFAFRSSTQEWDAARVSAAIPSGVGFLGGALIWKETTGEKGPNQRNHVHGITTAASVWLSASVGILAGGALWVCSAWTVILVVFVLRFGPTMAFSEDGGYQTSDATMSSHDDDDDDDDWNNDGKDHDENTRDMEESLRNFQALDNPDMKSSRRSSAMRRLHQGMSVADLRSIRQVERQKVNFHSD